MARFQVKVPREQTAPPGPVIFRSVGPFRCSRAPGDGRGPPNGGIVPLPLITLLGLLVAVLAVGCSAILIRLSDAPALVLSFYRLAISVALLAVPALARERGTLRRLTGRDWLLLAGSAVCLALHFYVWIESLNFTTVASSTVLVTSSPFIVLALGWRLLGERTNRIGLAAVAIGVAGGVIVGWGDFRVSGSALYGDLLAFLGAVTVSGYTIAGRIARQKMSTTLYTTAVYALAAALLWLMMLPRGIPLAPYPPREWALFAALAVIPTILGHNLFNWALRWVSAATVSMCTLGEPVIASALAWILFREAPGWATVVGGILLMAGIALFVRYGAQPD